MRMGEGFVASGSEEPLQMIEFEFKKT